MLKPFDLTVEEFQSLTEKIEYADKFGEEYREYIIPFLFEDAYLVKIKETFYKKTFYFDYGLGVFFNRGIHLVSEKELQEIVEEYAVTMRKIQTIREENGIR